MRASAAWMSIWDDRILEYVKENEGAAVGEISDSDLIRVSNAQVSRRCKRLAEHGLLRHIGNGVYVITDLGEDYLNEELDAAELEKSNGSSGEATV